MFNSSNGHHKIDNVYGLKMAHKANFHINVLIQAFPRLRRYTKAARDRATFKLS